MRAVSRRLMGIGMSLGGGSLSTSPLKTSFSIAASTLLSPVVPVSFTRTMRPVLSDQILITLLKPARFVTAYTRYSQPPPDFHAIVEVYLGGQWHLFDATGLVPLSDIIRIGTGRDALDVPFATFFGAARMRRLSPMVAAATGTETLVTLQTPGTGIVLAPMEPPLRGA